MQPRAPGDSLLIGRALAQSGQLNEAEAHFAQVLAGDPGQPEALAFALKRAMALGDHASVIAMTDRAIAAGVIDPTLFSALGHAHLFCGNRPAAAAALENSLALDPGQFQLRLKLGQLHETAGNRYQALTAYFRAVIDAQKQDRWKSEATTEPGLHEAVKQAMAFIVEGRERLFRSALGPLRRMHGAVAVERVDRCLDAYLGGMGGSFDHPMQRPTYLFVPGLSSAGFYPGELFPWIDELEKNAGAIREEALAVLAGGNGVLEPFLGQGSDGVATGQLRNDRGEAAWDAFFFYRHGRRYDENHLRCPVTSAVVEKLPLVRIEDHAPEILFSVLTPGSHILPHTGMTNSRLVAHLALVIPPGCAIRVGAETREWEEGRVLVFDDTHEHEAWNHGDQTRVVLIVDVWNHYLTAIEREAFSTLVQTMWSFHRACGFKSVEQSLEEQKLQTTTAM